MIVSRQFFVYSFIGGLGTLLTLSTYGVLVHFFGVHYQVANAIGYAAGTALSFVLNFRYNFRTTNRPAARFIVFSLVALAGWALSAALLRLFVRLWEWDAIHSYLVVVVAVVLLQYHLNRLVSFRPTSTEQVRLHNARHYLERMGFARMLAWQPGTSGLEASHRHRPTHDGKIPRMATSVPNTQQLETPASRRAVPAAVTEPFTAGRSAPRLIFDFGVMVSLMQPSVLDQPVLDFGSGTGWVSEFCARMNLNTVAFDIHGDLEGCLGARAAADSRIDPALLSFAHGDGHAMPFEPETFGHLLCYDTLHHMYDYPSVFAEFFRVLRGGGRAIFVEPGARHSTSPETVAFVEAQKKHDPDWIERDVVLEEIDQIARGAGFAAGLRIVPMPHPQVLQTYSMEAWSRFRNGDPVERVGMTDRLASINYWERVIFYVDKPV